MHELCEDHVIEQNLQLVPLGINYMKKTQAVAERVKQMKPLSP